MVFIVGIVLGYVAVAVIACVLLMDDGKATGLSIAAAIVWPVWGGPYVYRRMRRPTTEPDRGTSPDEP